jgi:hypothetical protein
MMTVQTRDFADVPYRSRELGCRVPERIALLPGNFSTAASAGEFCFHAATPHIRSAWKNVGLEDEGPCQTRDMTQSSSIGIVSQAEANGESARVHLVAFFGSGLLNGPAWRLTVALGMVSWVLASHARRSGQTDVRLDVVVARPRDRGYACIEYSGDAFGVVPLARDVRRVWAGA